METFANLEPEELVGWAFPCECGKTHRTALRALQIAPGALASLPAMLKTVNANRPFVLWDENTREAVGESARNALRIYPSFCYPAEPRPLPNERCLGQAVAAFDPACDLILAVGSGVLNDLAKMLGRVSGRPTGVVATAPSMDGYASNSAAMELSGVKTSVYTPAPVLVLGDVEVLKNAPEAMLRSGLGDMLAKETALCEWRVAALATGEAYCENVAALMRSALDRTVSSADGLLKRDGRAVQNVTEGLVVSGIAMGYSDTSRPASGTEHTLSHLWEMLALARGGRPAPHGLQVGLATRYMLRLYRDVAALAPTPARSREAYAAFRQEQWEAELRQVFGAQAEPMIAAALREGRNQPEPQSARAARALANWPAIRREIEASAARADQLIALMDAAGLPRHPGELNLSEADAKLAFHHSRDLRSRYLLTSLLWDLGELEPMEERYANLL